MRILPTVPYTMQATTRDLMLGPFALAPGTRIDRIAQITIQRRSGMLVMLIPNDRKFTVCPVSGRIHEMLALP